MGGRDDRRVNLGALDAQIGFNLRLAQDVAFRVFARHSGEAHLKPGRFAALAIIHDNPGIAPSELGRAIARDTAWKDYAAKTPLSAELIKLAEQVAVS